MKMDGGTPNIHNTSLTRPSLGNPRWMSHRSRLAGTPPTRSKGACRGRRAVSNLGRGRGHAVRSHWSSDTPQAQKGKPTVSFHNFKSQNFKLSVSNPESKYVAYLSVLSQISNCQGLGRKNKH